MSISYLNRAFATNIPAPKGKLTLIALANFASEDGIAFPSLSTLAQQTGQTPRTVINHLESLEKLGLIAREARCRENGSRTSNVYRLLMGGSETISVPLMKPFHEGSETISHLEPSFNHQEEPSFNQERESALEVIETAVVEPVVEPTKKPKKLKSKPQQDVYQPFLDLWNEQRFETWATCKALSPRRKQLISVLLEAYGGLEPALKMFGFALSEAKLTEWYVTRSSALSFENVGSNGKFIELAERFEARQAAKPVPSKPKKQVESHYDLLNNY